MMRASIAAIALLVSMGCGVPPSGAGADEPGAHEQLSALLELDAALSDIAEGAVRSVVNLSSTHGERGADVLSLGSGVIVGADGLVLTNSHLVRGADAIEVVLHDGSTATATVVGADRRSDVAVIRIQDPPDDLVPLPMGESSALELGQIVLAIGDPFGVGQTVTMGIVSATGRANLGLVDYEDFIQTDAAINPGNSGGALVNLHGELVGISTAIASQTGGSQGVGFAIPIDMAEQIMASLLEQGHVARGWLGVTTQDLEGGLAAALGLDVERGVLVSDVVAGSPAAAAGLEREDVIVGYGGEPVKRAADLRIAVAASGPDTPFSLEVARRGERRTLTGTLGLLEEEREGEQVAGGHGANDLTVGDLTRDVRDVLRVPDPVQGVVVVRVVSGSRPDRSGLLEGDIIVEVDRQPVSSVGTLDELLAEAEDPALLLVWREGATRYVLLD